MLKQIIIRFVKGMVAGAATSLAVVSYSNIQSWHDFNAALSTLAIACASGALTGLILAFEKWATWWTNDPEN